MPERRATGSFTDIVDPTKGGRVSLGRVALDFPADATHSGKPLTVNLTVRSTLPESPYRQLYVVCDVEATEPIPLNGRKQTTRKVENFKRPVQIEVDLADLTISGRPALSVWDQRLGHWWHLPTEVDTARNVARAETWHFSSFGLGDDTQSPTPPQTLESFQTSLFTGTAASSYNIEVPPGTGGLAPKITLTYSGQIPDDMNETWAQIAPDGNTNGDNAENALQATWVGLGWNIELGAVFRRGDNSYRLMLEGSSYELVEVDGSNPNDKRYRTKEDQFWLIRRIQESQNQHNSTGLYWLVRAKNGTEYRFGYNWNSDMLAGANQGSYVAWASLLDRIEDPHGNYVEIDYFEQIDWYSGGYDQAYYPSEIRYTKNDGQGLGWQRKVVLNRATADRSDAVTRPNEYQYYYKKKLDSIDVFLGTSLVRKYVFQYDDTKRPYWHKHNSDDQVQGQPKLLLTAIYQGDGTCPTGAVNGGTTVGNYLPPVRFTYHEGANAYGDGTYGKLHLKTVTNDLLGGSITYTYNKYVVLNPSGAPAPSKYRYRVVTQINSAGAGMPDVVRNFKYTWAWRDDATLEFRGHDDVAVQDSLGYQEYKKFYTTVGANGKSREDCDFLRGKAYREGTLDSNEAFQTVTNYATDLGAYSAGRPGWNYVPGKFSIGTTNELRMGLIQNTTYNQNDNYTMVYQAPSYTAITKVEFDWSANYDNAKIVLSMDYPDHPDSWTNNAYGANSGHQIVEIAGGASFVSFGMFSRGGFTYTYPTGEWYGRIYNLKVYYRSILQSKDSTWNYVTTVGSARHIQLQQVDEKLDTQPRRTRYTYEINYGNVTDIREDGDPNIADGERHKVISYAVNAADNAWIVDRVSQEQVFEVQGGGEVEKSRTRHYYDRDAYENRRAHGSAPTKGDLIAVERVYLGNEAKNSWTDYWYDGFGNLTREQDGRGNQTNATYETTYRTFLYTITNAKSQVETRDYDPTTGKPNWVTDINNQRTDYVYDSFKRLIKLIKPGDSSASPTILYEYYVNTGQAAPRFAVTAKLKDTSTDGIYQGKSWYDGLGRVVQKRSENAAGSNPIVVDTNFDGRGLKYTESVPYVSATNTWDFATDNTQPKTTYQYEGLRRVSQVNNPDSTVRKSYYSGRSASVVDEKDHRRDLTNDPFDRLKEVKEYTGAYPGSIYATTSYSFDVLNNLVQVTDNAGNITKMEYNSLSQTLKMHDPDRSGSNNTADASYWWSYEYDLAGNLTKQTDAKGQVIELAYDELNRLLRKYYTMDWVSDIAAGTSKPSVYDIIELRSAVDVNRALLGLGVYNWSDPALIAGKDVKVRAVHFTELKTAIQNLWTQAGLGSVPEFTGGAIVYGTRKIKASDLTDLRTWLGQYETSGWAQEPGFNRRARAYFAYDEFDGVNQFGRGRRTAMHDVSGRHYYRYDTRGRLVRDEQLLDGQSYITQYTYDAMDRVATMKYPDNETLTYTYGDHTKLTAIASDTGVNYLQSASYNQLLKPKVLTLASGATTTFSYFGTGLDDPAQNIPYGSLKSVATTKTGLPTIQDLQHSYDKVGNMTWWKDNAASPVEDFTYEYDDLDRLTKKKITAGADIETFDFGNAGGKIGNIWKKNGVEYFYGSPLRVHAVTSFIGVSYGYDNNGNMASAGNWSYGYDKENRMAKATLSGAVQARFAYDGDGKRGKRVDANGTIHYVGGHYERNVGNGLDTIEKITKYYYASLGSVSKLIALRKSGILYYVHADHLGSSTRITDASGNIVDSSAYTAYGETRSGGTNLQTDRKFTGQILDLSTGLYWYSSRPYNPALCRFVQPDTIVPGAGNPQALNRYSYTLNNPLKYTDPTGHWYEAYDSGRYDDHSWYDDSGQYDYDWWGDPGPTPEPAPTPERGSSPGPTPTPEPAWTPEPAPAPTPDPPYGNTDQFPISLGGTANSVLPAADWIARNVVAAGPGPQPSFPELVQSVAFAATQVDPRIGGVIATLTQVAEGLSVVMSIIYAINDLPKSGPNQPPAVEMPQGPYRPPYYKRRN